MLAEPNCFTRRCINFIDVENTKKPQDKKSTVDGVILSCKAFKKGIPREIAYGKNLHLKPVKGDNGILFEKAKSDEEFINRDI
jgi:hypothetical protein